MKIRNDYVSNSSSSSFIIILDDAKHDETSTILKMFSDYSNESYPYVFPNKEYKYEFGWEFEDTHSFGGKLNFIGIQLLYLYQLKLDDSEDDRYVYYKGNPSENFDKFYGMVKKVCREQFNMAVELDTSFVKEHSFDGKDGKKEIYHSVDGCYIDHQSCVTENECMDMFNSEKDLIDFLSNKESHIKGGNDNE